MGIIKIDTNDLIRVVIATPDQNGQISIGRALTGRKIRIYVERLEEKYEI
ncbi:MAG: hypothetical protein KKH98_06595 [Spirochaetes bacterium]|nr:hypothetical protein [Spirochaetota bacterium]